MNQRDTVRNDNVRPRFPRITLAQQMREVREERESLKRLQRAYAVQVCCERILIGLGLVLFWLVVYKLVF